jgi:hypothetical protein
MKKKVLPPFHQHYTPAEESLISTAKAHLVALKRQGLVIIPFAFMVDISGKVEAVHPSVFSQNSGSPFIEQLWQSGKKRSQAREASCFLVCYDAHVFDAEEVDQDALVILLRKEGDSSIQVNVPYVVAETDLVFGEGWTSAFSL